MSNTASDDHKGSRQILGVNPAIHRAWVSHSTDRDLDVGADTAFAPDRPGEARRISLGRRGFHSGSATALALADGSRRGAEGHSCRDDGARPSVELHPRVLGPRVFAQRVLSTGDAIVMNMVNLAADTSAAM